VPDSNNYQAKKAFFDRILTVYGRKPVLETLRDPQLQCHALHLAENNRQSGIVADIEASASARGIPVKYHSRAELARLSKNGKQDQGVALDILCPGFSSLKDYLQTLISRPPQRLLALDGITNPQNLGMIIRSATAGRIDGIIWTRRGNAALGPLVIKASTGTLYRAPLLIGSSMTEALGQCRQAGIEVCTLAADASQTLFEHRPEGHCVYVLGNETDGVSQEVARLADHSLSIPMENDVESLNVAVTASLIAYAGLLNGN
jgi:23S rRNA (guanosine2251-2'-O)-methyltransferase